MEIKRKIALVLCLFLTVAPIIGSYLSVSSSLADNIGNLIPYISYRIVRIDDISIIDGVFELLGDLIFLVGLIGFIIFIVTRFKKVDTLLFLLYSTVLNCGIRAIGTIIIGSVLVLNDWDISNKGYVIIVILSQIIWGLFCFWAARVLRNKPSLTPQNQALRV